MTTQEILLLPREEFVTLAESFYQRVVRPQVDSTENQGKPLALDLETEHYVIAADGVGLDAAAQIREHNPNARPFLRRIGYRSFFSFAGELVADTPAGNLP